MKNTGQVFCRLICWDWADIFLVIRLGLCIWGRKTTEKYYVHHILLSTFITVTVTEIADSITWLRLCMFASSTGCSCTSVIRELCSVFWASLVAQLVKNLPAMQETRVHFLGREDPLKRRRQSTPVFLPEESHGQRSLAGYSPWGHNSRTRLSDWTTTTTVYLSWLCCFSSSSSLSPSPLLFLLHLLIPPPHDDIIVIQAMPQTGHTSLQHRSITQWA